ncbi:MAG: HU family DNA-binding protein [Polyangiaceae bacterium]|nr:HU family DNA-binding protein [Polyangiaceae bacterium]
MAASNKLTKSQFIAALAESAGLDKKSAANVLEALLDLVKKQLGDGGPGEVTIPGIAKFKAKSTPATQDREGINPFTKEKTIIKGKPASRKIRASAVKPLKE